MNGKVFKVGGVWLKKLPHSKVPIAIGMMAIALSPAIAAAKGPIVRASVDWVAFALAILFN